MILQHRLNRLEITALNVVFPQMEHGPSESGRSIINRPISFYPRRELQGIMGRTGMPIAAIRLNATIGSWQHHIKLMEETVLPKSWDFSMLFELDARIDQKSKKGSLNAGINKGHYLACPSLSQLIFNSGKPLRHERPEIRCSIEAPHRLSSLFIYRLWLFGTREGSTDFLSPLRRDGSTPEHKRVLFPQSRILPGSDATKPLLFAGCWVLPLPMGICGKAGLQGIAFWTRPKSFEGRRHLRRKGGIGAIHQ